MMNETTIASDVPHGNHADAVYDAFLARVNARFLANVGDTPAPLFATDAEGTATHAGSSSSGSVRS